MKGGLKRMIEEISEKAEIRGKKRKGSKAIEEDSMLLSAGAGAQPRWLS